MIEAIKRILASVSQPSVRETGYTWAIIATGHVMLGAAFASVWPVALLLYAAKEVRDLRRGGRLADGVADFLLVAVGLTYTGPLWWPVAVFGTVCAGAVIKEARR